MSSRIYSCSQIKPKSHHGSIEKCWLPAVRCFLKESGQKHPVKCSKFFSLLKPSVKTLQRKHKSLFLYRLWKMCFLSVKWTHCFPLWLFRGKIPFIMHQWGFFLASEGSNVGITVWHNEAKKTPHKKTHLYKRHAATTRY